MAAEKTWQTTAQQPDWQTTFQSLLVRVLSMDGNDASFVSRIVSSWIPLASLKCDLLQYERAGFPKEGKSTLDTPMYDTRKMGVWQFYAARNYNNKQWFPLTWTFRDHGPVGLARAFIHKPNDGQVAALDAPAISAYKLVRDIPMVIEGSPGVHDVMLHPGEHQKNRLLIVRWKSHSHNEQQIRLYCRVCKPLEKDDPVGISIWLNGEQLFPVRNDNQHNFCIFVKPAMIELKASIKTSSTLDFAFDPVGNYCSDQTQFELYIAKD